MAAGRGSGGSSRKTTSNVHGNVRPHGVRPKSSSPRRFSPDTFKNLNRALRAASDFLQKEDTYRTVGWHDKFEQIQLLLQEAEARRNAGDESLDSYAVAKLEESLTRVELHRRFEMWKNGMTRFTTAQPLKLNHPPRLAPYDRQPPILCKDEGKPPSTYTSLVPRPNEVTYSPFMHLPTFKDEPDWKSFFVRADVQPLLRLYMVFYQHADMWPRHNIQGTKWGKKFPMMQNPDNPDGANLAQFENVLYEGSVNVKWDDFMTYQRKLNNAKNLTDLTVFAIQRGIKRAAIQKVLNLITNDENRVVNSPWRRVIFPRPTRHIRLDHFSPWAVSRMTDDRDELGHHTTIDVNRYEDGEPSLWIYWFNEWRQQANHLSAWTRQSYSKRYWNDFKRISLPTNFRGPYSFKDQCVYDDYWLKMGQQLVILQGNLEKRAVTNSRWLLERVVEDIKRGENGEAIDNEVIPRPNVDLVIDKPDKYQLIDEADMAWLRFLCQPATTKALAGLSLSSPEDTLTILLDHRLQILFNDLLHNPFWMTDISANDEKRSFRPREMPLEHLLPMINSGGREFGIKDWKDIGLDMQTEYQKAPRLTPTGAPIPNSLYQFSLKEAKLHCSKLAEMGRIAYKRPEDPKEFNEMWWSGKGTLYYYPDANFQKLGGIVVPVPPGVDSGTNSLLGTDTNADDNPVRYPEERIRWRYKNKAALDNENEYQKELYASETFKRNRALPNSWQYPKEAYEKNFLPEIVWVQGPWFHARSMEAIRESPAWKDILDYRTVLAKDVGYSNKTINFMRNLAYRMGRTIRHYKALQKSVAKPSSLTRRHLHTALDEWNLHVENTWANEKDPIDATVMPFKLGSPISVIMNVYQDSANQDGKCLTTVYKEIRDGIIDDMVKNKTMRYPGRRNFYTDKRQFLGFFYDREKIWSWGSQEIRARHAVYRRERYFDMKRWPVNRQTKECTRTSITTRADEDASIQPVSALYKYNIRVGPVKMVAEHSDVVSQLVALLQDPDKMTIARQLVQHLSKEVVKIVKNTDNGFGPGWEIRIAPPGTKIRTTHANSSRTTSLESTARPKQKFHAGPAVFPMGDTLLQQVKLSQDLEKILDPKPSSIGNTIISHIVDFIVPPPVRIPLVPEIDLAKAPSTSRLNLKRKVNTAFITSDERAPKRQTIHRIQSSGNKGQQNGKGSGRGGPQGNDNRGGSSSDSDGAWSDTDSEFDYLLPPHSRSSGKVSTTYKKKDGTWKIKIEPDLEDVMKVDITGSEPSTTRRTGGRAVVNARPGQFNTPAPKPTVGARKVHIKNPIIQDPQSHSSITEDSSSEPVPSLFAEKDNPSNGSARTTEIIQPGQHLAGTIAQSRSSPPSSTPVPTGMAPTGDASKAVPTPSPGNICKLFPSPPRNDNTRFGNTTWLSAAPVTQPGSFSIFGTMGPSSISVTRPQDNDAARVPGRQEIYETLMATTEVDLSASADTTAFQQRPGPRPTTTSKPTYAEILKRTPSVQQPAESPERAAFETQENLVSFLNSHIMSPSIAPGNASAAEYSWSRLKTPTDTAGNTNHSKSPQSRLSTPVDTAGLTPIAAKLYEELADDFDAKFPRGFKILRTSGTRLLCALYAIMDSMKAQYPREEQPTLEDLNRSFKNPVDEDIIAAKEHADMGNHNDLSLDQATSTLYDWGMRRGKVWQLAAYVPAQKRQHMMVGIPERPGARRLWIQNNATQAELDAGIEAEKKEEANRGGHGLGLSDLQDLHAIGFDNHYSGLEAN